MPPALPLPAPSIFSLSVVSVSGTVVPPYVSFSSLDWSTLRSALTVTLAMFGPSVEASIALIAASF